MQLVLSEARNSGHSVRFGWGICWQFYSYPYLFTLI